MAFKYRADHVGSFLRPQHLLDARHNPNTTHEQLKALEDQEILKVIEKQKQLGFKIFTDGELRRFTFMSDFNDSVTGLDTGTGVQRQWAGGQGSHATTLQVSGVVIDKVKQTRRLTKHETDFVLQHSPGDVKVTLPTVNQFPAIAYKKGISDKVYPTYSDFLWDIVPIVHSEIKALCDEGVKYIQIDAPRYSYYIDPKWRDYVKNEMGKDPDEALDEAIAVDNACLEGIKREGVVICIHLCRGNNRSEWYAEGGYDPIAEKLFSELNVDAFSLEYEDERSGSFEPLRFVPRDKQVILGLVSSKLARLESQDDLIRRIEEASKYVSLDNLALEPQCGFASVEAGNLLTEDEQWAKLKLVVDTAKRVWKDA
ncbi:MAG TPA: methionine synthase [Dehalococcoidia bacterium]|nr:methionine synthase [Dehalococcoidia bacterium]